MSSTSHKRKWLKLTDKAKIIDEVALGARVTQLAKKYGVSKATICKIKHLKTQILQRTYDTFRGPGNRKTLKNAKAPKMENSLNKWFLKQREKHAPISGEILKEKAKLLNEKLKETENFVASDGWLQRFKRRYGIRLLSISGEKLSAQPELIQPLNEKLPKTINEVDLKIEQIDNADKSGPANSNLWNEDKQTNDKEEDMDSEEDEGIPIEVRNVVTDAQAIQVFNQALDWAERKDVSFTDILVLCKLRAQALEDNANAN